MAVKNVLKTLNSPVPILLAPCAIHQVLQVLCLSTDDRDTLFACREWEKACGVVIVAVDANRAASLNVDAVTGELDAVALSRDDILVVRLRGELAEAEGLVGSQASSGTGSNQRGRS